MPKLPVATGAEVVRALKRVGFVFDRQSGSHVILKDPTRGKIVSVPVHSGRDVTPGSMRSVLRQAGLTADELREALR